MRGVTNLPFLEFVFGDENGDGDHPVVTLLALPVVCGHVHLYQVFARSGQLLLEHQVGRRLPLADLLEAELGAVAFGDGELVLLTAPTRLHLDAENATREGQA